MALPAWNQNLSSNILFVAEGPFQLFTNKMKEACAAQTTKEKTEAIARAVIALLQSSTEILYPTQQVKTWVIGVFTAAGIRLNDQTHLDEPDIRKWTTKALGSHMIDAKICRSFSEACKTAVLKQIDAFDEKINPNVGDFEWVGGLEGAHLAQLGELLQPGEKEDEEAVIVDHPMISKESWSQIVGLLRKDPFVLL